MSDVADPQYDLRTDELSWREIDGQVIVLDLRTKLYLSINDSGVALWRRLAGGARRAELVATLQETYGIPEEQASTDTDAFLASLEERGLLSAARAG